MKSAARPRDARVTRERLLQAARTRLAVHGYDDVTLRGIAADVGVDVAMIHRYFGTKDDLFREVLDTEAPSLRFLEGDPGAVGERLATAVFQGSVEAADLDNLMILVRSLGSERGRALAQGTRITRFQQPLIDWLRGPHASERAFLISSVVVGAIVTREFLGKSCGPDADYGAVQTRFAEILQTLVET
ncbi:MAG: TetR/AcrR family transcriptional regulator [Pseudomonadota bacterium]|nr:TetR/AcrR family transcriptional regulator [Pseudomonadota bacterium]